MTAGIDLLFAEVTARLAEHKRLEARRLFHGRGNCFTGWEHFNIDYYPPVVIFQLYREMAGLDHLIQTMEPLFGKKKPRCWLSQDRFLPKTQWRILKGAVPKPCRAREDGFSYDIELMRKQNIGFFPDMREGRRLVHELAPGKRVLNLFAYTCSFSVVAVNAGALEVYNLDVAKSALRTGKTNHNRNRLNTNAVHFLPHDVMKSFGKMNRFGPFGLVIIDPPTRQKGSFAVEKDYAKLARRMPEFLEDGADVVACLNAPHLGGSFLDALFAKPHYHLIQRRQRPPDFPEKDPDRGLKIHHYRFGNG